MVNAAVTLSRRARPARPASDQGTPGPPSISNGGVVPIDSSQNTIQPGEWISIWGSNLAGGTFIWNGDRPTSLGETSVEIDGRPAYLMFVSPDQINLQAPDDTAAAPV
jgi:hypothetical protein